MERDRGEAPKRPVSVILLLSNQANLKFFLSVKHTTLITYNHHPWTASGYIPNRCSLCSIMDGDCTEGGEKCAPALNELTVYERMDWPFAEH